MLNAPIVLNLTQIKEHVNYLSLITNTFGAMPFSPGMTVGEGIKNIQVISAVSMMVDPALLENVLATIERRKQQKQPKQGKPISIYDNLRDPNGRQVMGCTLVGDLVTYFMMNAPFLMSINEAAYHQSLGYLMLLSALYGYNAAATYQKTPENELFIRQFIDKSIDWMVLFESVNLTNLPRDFCSDLRRVLCQNLMQLKVKAVIQKPREAAYPDPYLLPSELIALVKRKNERAKLYGLPCEHVVIHRDNPNMLFQVDLHTLALLTTELAQLRGTAQQKHFLFYTNHDFGPVELLSARYNPTTNQLELVNISGGNSVSQFHFLGALKLWLDAGEVPYKILACQANMLPSQNASAFYAYLLSGILGSKTFEQLKAQQFKTAQPMFEDAFERTTKDFPILNDVHWFDVGALEKALFLAPTHEAIKQRLSKVYSPSDASKRFSHMMQKYNLTLGYFNGQYRYYYEYAYHRAKLHLANEKDALTHMEILHKLLSDNDDFEKEEAALQALSKTMAELTLKNKAKKSRKAKNTLASTATKPKSSVSTPMDKQAIVSQEARALYRAARGDCTLEQFQMLLENPFVATTIDMVDEQKQDTPLIQSILTASPKRTLMLLNKGAKVDIKSGTGQSARECYDALSADSPIKRNTKIGAYFK